MNLKFARDEEDAVRTALTVENEQKLKGDASHRTERILQINAYFRQEYTDILANGELPYTLLDGKKAIREFRRYITSLLVLHFTDMEVIHAFSPDEIAQDLREVVAELEGMFPLPEAEKTKNEQEEKVEGEEKSGYGNQPFLFD